MWIKSHFHQEVIHNGMSAARLEGGAKKMKVDA